MTKSLTPMLLIVFLFLFLAINPVQAQLMVQDNAAIAKALQQLQQLQQQYDKMKQQYETLLRIEQEVKGSYGVSLLNNKLVDEQGRRIMPGTWQEVVALQKSGALPGIYNERQNYFKKLLPTTDTKVFSKNPNDPLANSYKLSSDNTQAAFATTETLYNQVQKRIETIEDLTKEIDKTKNIKNSTDLNSRIAAENGFLNSDLARLQAMQLSLQANMQNMQNQAASAQAQFYSGVKNYGK